MSSFVPPHRSRRRAAQAGAAAASSSAPTSTCRRTTPATSPKTRASAPRCRASSMALDAGAAVMVTSHLGRPTEGEFKPEDSLAPVAERLAELLGRAGAAAGGLGRRRRRSRRARSCCWRTAASTRARRRTTTALAQKMAALCDIYVNDAFGTAHRAEATTYGIAAVRADRLRRPAAGRRDRRASRKALAAAAAAAGGDRRRLQGLDQADRSCRAWPTRSTS